MDDYPEMIEFIKYAGFAVAAAVVTKVCIDVYKFGSSRQIRDKRYTVNIVNSGHIINGVQETSTMKLEFGSREEAQKYAEKYLGQPGFRVEIADPPTTSN